LPTTSVIAVHLQLGMAAVTFTGAAEMFRNVNVAGVIELGFTTPMFTTGGTTSIGAGRRARWPVGGAGGVWGLAVGAPPGGC
jgi:hypothetical protein